MKLKMKIRMFGLDCITMSRGSVQRHLENVEKRRRTRSSSVGEDSSIFNVCGRASALETERERERQRQRENDQEQE